MFIDWSLLRFPFDDDRWKGKFAIGGLLYILAIVASGPFILLMVPVLGFGFQIMRRAALGEERRLPDWQGWGKLFSDGFRVFGVSFVYGLPVTVVVTCFMTIWLIAFFSVMGAQSGARFQDFQSLLAPTIFTFYGGLFVMIGCISLIAIPLNFLQAVALSRMAGTDKFSSALEFGEVWKLAKRGFPNYLLAMVALWGVAVAGSLLSNVLVYTVVLACLAPFVQAVAFIYAEVMSSTLFGMAYYHTNSMKREDVHHALQASRKSTAPLNMPRQDHVDPKDEFSTMPGTPSSITGTMISDKTPPASEDKPKKKRVTKKPGSASPTKGE